ncbi:MAG: DNA alkylation repair protein [Deltaproteobacteria bacterium]|nr:DNA alkylation repair protein [Deltaproteobacteria bacterium]
MAPLKPLRAELAALANPAKAQVLQGFFKTGPGQYGQGDVFLGVVMPELRRLARAHSKLPRQDISVLLASPVHEERMLGLLLIMGNYQRGDTAEQKDWYEFYVHHLEQVNNWDLVDVTCSHVVGHYLFHQAKSPKQPNHQPNQPTRSRPISSLSSPEHGESPIPGELEPLEEWAGSPNLWIRRVAMVSTHYFIRQGELTPTFHIAQRLLNDPHDLIHKAVGWMLREAGKRDQPALEAFLSPRYATMPRTMLRYAIEKFSEKKRQAYLKGKSSKAKISS